MGKGDAVVLDGHFPAKVLSTSEKDAHLLFPSGTRCSFDLDRITAAP